ncbi:hypothetical protein [Lacrimispora amygdalina]|uniref:hypothetical protein n=1 Tax=Lacrimispora amygdalina TaxID=253257 RepID=UPI000BE42F27|nr:hypothetical protein [Lacrimispora amygdalina]
MKNETKNYKFPKPGEDDFYDINEYNGTLDSIDEELMNQEQKKLDKTGDSSQTVTTFEEEVLRENLESGESLSLTHGKIKKWFSEMKNIAFSGRASDIETDGANRFVSDGEKKDWNSKVSADGDISDTKIKSLDSVSSEFPVPEEGESSRQFFGKVRKFIQDYNNFKTGIITVGKLVNNGSTTAGGYALDARYGKTLFDLYNKLNSDLQALSLYSDVSYYVATTGSDTIGDGSETSPYASITKALSVVPKDLSGCKATIFISDGTYNENITIRGFDNGQLVLRRQGDLVLNSLCNAGSIAINTCESISVIGLNFTTENVTSMYVDRCKFVLVEACQSIVSAPSNPSFSFDYTPTVRITNCRSLNHAICLRSYSSYIYSGSWSNSVGNQYGTYVGGGGQIFKGDMYQTTGTTLDDYYVSGGIVASNYGAKIGTLRYDLTLYVATTGSDITGDGTSENPFRTIQHAVDILPKDLGGHTATIIVANGVYFERLQVDSFHGGIIYIKSNAETVSDEVTVSYVNINYCSALTIISGIKINNSDDDASIRVTSNSNVLLNNLKITTLAPTKMGIRCGESNLVRIAGCDITGKLQAVACVNTQAYMQNCTGANNSYACNTSGASVLHILGTYPGSTYGLMQTSGGMIVDTNGTQISGLITAGLSCTWGTLKSGYVRHGNLNGMAMVSICLEVTTTTTLTSGTVYSITGFPKPITVNDIAVASNTPPTINSWLQSSTGYLQMSANVQKPVGTVIQLSVTYPTNS